MAPSRPVASSCNSAILGGKWEASRRMGVEVEISTRQQQCFAGDVVEGTVNLNVSTVSSRANEADLERVSRGAPVDQKILSNTKYGNTSTNTYGIFTVGLTPCHYFINSGTFVQRGTSQYSIIVRVATFSPVFVPCHH